MELLHARCAGVDVHSANVVACARIRRAGRSRTTIERCRSPRRGCWSSWSGSAATTSRRPSAVCVSQRASTRCMTTCVHSRILLMLARLGLRGGEVAELTLDDIDWTAGRLTVHGKGGRMSQFPLPRM
jgi:hypothetical protein